MQIEMLSENTESRRDDFRDLINGLSECESLKRARLTLDSKQH